MVKVVDKITTVSEKETALSGLSGSIANCVIAFAF